MSEGTFGYLLPTRELVMAQVKPDFESIISLGEQAESLGFDSLWVGDSILARPRFEALTTLATLASRTRKLRQRILCGGRIPISIGGKYLIFFAILINGSPIGVPTRKF